LQISNKIIRRNQRIGAGLLVGACLFVAVSATGLLFSGADAPDTWTAYFEVGTRPANEAEAAIAAVSDAAFDAPSTLVIVTGHTGAQGDADANLELSRQRANVIAEKLRASGVPADRIVARGAGGAAPPPVSDDESAASQAQRAKRVEIRLVERSLVSEAMAR